MTDNDNYASPLGILYVDLEAELRSVEEIAASNFCVDIIAALFYESKDAGISRRKLVKLSGVKEKKLARIERDPEKATVETLLELLKPLGKTLAIIPAVDALDCQQKAAQEKLKLKMQAQKTENDGVEIASGEQERQAG